MDETVCINQLLMHIAFSKDELHAITALAAQLVEGARRQHKKATLLSSWLQRYDLSSAQGIAMMCVAEALLRIPDKATRHRLILDKLDTITQHQHHLAHRLIASISRLGISLARPIVVNIIKAMGKQFIMGETIQAAIQHSTDYKARGYSFSFDMLGEAAITQEEAKRYYQAYEHAIEALKNNASSALITENPGISIKLSALHPRFEYTQRERMQQELAPLLLALAKKAKQARIGLTIDAEEADRLDLTLDLFEKIYKDPALADWEGLGLAVQAYQKRAPFVIDWLAALAKAHGKRIMVRLVKGAYWDSEIKASQVLGLDYPVFTRKSSTDVSYLACAKKLLANTSYFYPQFGTHNAFTIAAILTMVKDQHTAFEFQCLFGMGEPLYDQLLDKKRFNCSCRIYAPVGTYHQLLGYLVRRLLENGANSSFIHHLYNENIAVETLIKDPIARTKALTHFPHPRIPSFKNIYLHWQNSAGIDCANPHELSALYQHLMQINKQRFAVYQEANEKEIEQALMIAKQETIHWGATNIEARAAMLEKAAELLQQAMPELLALIVKEGKRTLRDALSEVREAIDFCRYYAYCARRDLTPRTLPGPVGELNQLTLHPRGVIVCISPWNFPMAIFTGQITAALAAGNCVIAKPAEQTPLIATRIVEILHQAGIPTSALQLLYGKGEQVGAALVKDGRVDGILFTGGTDTAKYIEQTLAYRQGPIATLIAETGGQNAMIVDSSALLPQAVMDIVQSAFNSAGQRCSALRVLFVQTDIAPQLLTQLHGYMQELVLGDPQSLTTDIGPMIDVNAVKNLQTHLSLMQKVATLVAAVPRPSSLPEEYFAPCAFELPNLASLKQHLTHEVFGPILHIVRYRANQLDQVLDTVIETGYGLTLGIHSRIDTTINHIIKRMPVGNVYVNRNMIGAVVGVQPFGGERLSGTGPKAGGPYYLPRLCVERTISNNITAIGGNAHLVSLNEDEDT